LILLIGKPRAESGVNAPTESKLGKGGKKPPPKKYTGSDETWHPSRNESNFVPGHTSFFLEKRKEEVWQITCHNKGELFMQFLKRSQIGFIPDEVWRSMIDVDGANKTTHDYDGFGDELTPDDKVHIIEMWGENPTGVHIECPPPHFREEGEQKINGKETSR
jgi:hypothetical protein